MPILVFLAATVPYDPASPRAIAGLLALTLAAVLGFSELTEQRRDPWRKALRRLFRVPEKARPT